jgi:hypothetical protein
MRRTIVAGVMLAAALTSACSTNGGMYKSGDSVNGEFSGWKTAGAVALGILTLGAVAAGAAVGAQNHTTYSPNNVTFVSGNNHVRTYLVNGEYVTCYRTGNMWNCY